MTLKSAVGKTCVWCVAAAVAALTLLTIIWTVMIINQ
jgi:hypothetical protein